ncbi:DUF1214 domain-containing protein [Streptomyces sp. WAC01280]|uniref:DUF1214 domain-containing protein n=1 Tax=Streptomyces sp. WAC01280 TaxID=2487424 RepID=UPI0028AB6BC4|nr:DUF1214 domain-containing protein [Streptomyces sp. WAC01280]
MSPRYSLGDRTPGLVYGADGSLTVVIQHERPEDPAEAANWLPAPKGDFRPMVRLHTPGRPSSTAPTGCRPSPRGSEAAVGDAIGGCSPPRSASPSAPCR